MYGHIVQLAEAEKAGLKKAGIDADIYQVAETLSEEVLTKVRQHARPTCMFRSQTNNHDKMYAPPKKDYPIIDAKTLESYDAFLFGIPTRFGNFPAQWKAFFDTTGGQVSSLS
jgi:NAD(P)H dehydrogenase (quinone)